MEKAMLTHLQDLMNHMAWADAVFFHALGKADEAKEDPGIQERLTHSLGTQELFLQNLKGEDRLPWERILAGKEQPPWAGRPNPGFEALKEWARRNHAGFAAFLGGCEEDQLQRKVRIPWIPAPPCLLTVAEALLQVSLHTQHHRGQCITLMKALGGQPKNVDFLIWVWKGRPAPRWG
jgi:uncharacterized damage-inducible protein DinB